MPRSAVVLVLCAAARMRFGAPVGVSPQAVVARDLLRGKKLASVDVGREVDAAQPRLRAGDLRGQLPELLIADLPGPERRVKPSFECDDAPAQSPSARVHRSPNRPDGALLLAVEPQSVAQLEDVHRPWIVVELRGQRISRTPTREQIGHALC